ncbi:hypothetical protein [Methylobacillus flagellatus]|uniref:Uncharacterized protein n=1 Tax=Methylobacillus flagellatus (strain ATCC 51484 / DSM 6875 / VKM B-1610 / KT) TaxID=265072 RepID=Q1GXT2_METFK|nr:hypothetical protein [Methylobacillus flagellatus]ABE50955.1 conserved hypothetical protein [Methylobacillus flagellatus KT]
MLFSGQGSISLGKRDASGKPLGLRPVGDATLTIALATEVEEHTEKQTGQRLVNHRLSTKKTATTTIVADEWDIENLALALYGEVTRVTGGTVTAEALPNPVDAGLKYLLQHNNVSDVVITDSTTGTAKALPVSQYSVHGPGGSIVVQDKATGGPFVEPFLAAYAYGATDKVGMFTQPVPEVWLHFEGVNTADNNKPVIVDLYKVQIDPTRQLDLITDSYGTFELVGNALLDLLRPADDELGQFGSIAYPQITP